MSATSDYRTFHTTLEQLFADTDRAIAIDQPARSASASASRHRQSGGSASASSSHHPAPARHALYDPSSSAAVVTDSSMYLGPLDPLGDDDPSEFGVTEDGSLDAAHAHSRPSESRYAFGPSAGAPSSTRSAGARRSSTGRASNEPHAWTPESLDLLSRVEQLRGGLDAVRRSSESASRSLDRRMRTALHSILTRVQTQATESRQIADQALTHSVDSRRKVKKELAVFKGAMEGWCQKESVRLESIERKVGSKEAHFAQQALSPSAQDRRASAPVNADGPTRAEFLQLQALCQTMASKSHAQAEEIELLRNAVTRANANARAPKEDSRGAQGAAPRSPQPVVAAPPAPDTSALERRVAALEAQLARYSSDADRLDELSEQSAQRLDSVEAELADQGTQLRTQHEQMTRGSERMTAMKEDVAEIKRSASAAPAAVGSPARATGADAVVGELKATLAALQSRLARFEESTAIDLRAIRESALNASRESTESYASFSRATSVQGEALSSLVEGLKTSAQAAKDEAHKAQSFRDMLHEELTAVVEGLAAAEGRVDALEQDMDAKNDAAPPAPAAVVDQGALALHAALRERVEVLEKSSRTLRSEGEANQQKLLGEFSKLGDEVTALSSALASDTLDARVTHLFDQVDELTVHVHEFEEYSSGEISKHDGWLLQHESLLRGMRGGRIGEGDEGEEDGGLSMEDPLDAVSMDLPGSRTPKPFGSLAVHIPQTRPGSAASVISTTSFHPTMSGFLSKMQSPEASLDGTGGDRALFDQALDLASSSGSTLAVPGAKGAAAPGAAAGAGGLFSPTGRTPPKKFQLSKFLAAPKEAMQAKQATTTAPTTEHDRMRSEDARSHVLSNPPSPAVHLGSVAPSPSSSSTHSSPANHHVDTPKPAVVPAQEDAAAADSEYDADPDFESASSSPPQEVRTIHSAAPAKEQAKSALPSSSTDADSPAALALAEDLRREHAKQSAPPRSSAVTRHDDGDEDDDDEAAEFDRERDHDEDEDGAEFDDADRNDRDERFDEDDDAAAEREEERKNRADPPRAGQTLLLSLSCDQLPFKHAAIQVSEFVVPDEQDSKASWQSRGWTEDVSHSSKPEFVSTVPCVFLGSAPGDVEQEIRFDLFDLSATGATGRPRLAGSVHAFLAELVRDLAEGADEGGSDFPFAGMIESIPLGETPRLTVRLSVASREEEEVAEASKPPAWAAEEEKSVASADAIPSKLAASTASSASPVSASLAAGIPTASSPVPTLHPRVALLVRLTNLPLNDQGHNRPLVALFAQDATLSPHAVSRTNTTPPTRFTFACQSEWLQDAVDAEFSQALVFDYHPGHILKLNVYDADSLEISDAQRLGSVFVRADDLFDAAGEGLDDQGDEDVVRELTFYLSHEDPAKHERLKDIELVVEAHIQDDDDEEDALDEQLRREEDELEAEHKRAEASARSPTFALALEKALPFSQLNSPEAARSNSAAAEERTTTPAPQKHDVRMSISCKGLPVSKANGTVDPIVAAFLQHEAGGEFAYENQTEWLRDAIDPDFADHLVVSHTPFANQLIRFSVYDVASEEVADEDRVGSVVVKMDELFASGGAADFRQKQALLEGIGSSSTFALLHDNPAKNALLAGATICIRYEASSLNGDVNFSPSVTDSTPVSYRDEDAEDDRGSEHLDSDGAHSPSSASPRAAHSSELARSANHGLHRQSHQQNLESSSAGARGGLLHPADSSKTKSNNPSPRRPDIDEMLSNIANERFSDEDDEEEPASDEEEEEPWPPARERALPPLASRPQAAAQSAAPVAAEDEIEEELELEFEAEI